MAINSKTFFWLSLLSTGKRNNINSVMKTVGIISVGSEIMSGKIDDTNSTYISRCLAGLGLSVTHRCSTKDVLEDIVSAIEHTSFCDLVILTGGLGPTADDITREALAKYLNKKLIFQSDEYKKIISFFNKMNRPSPESNKKQAELIDGAEFLCNNKGTAPGMFCQSGNKIFVLLPGPPQENQFMIQQQLLPKLEAKGFVNKNLHTKIYRLYNVGESYIADMFSSFNENIEIGYYAISGGWCEIHLSKHIVAHKQINEFERTIKKVEDILTEYKVFFTEDKDLSLLVLEMLEKKKLTLSFAESITGGNISGEFVKNAGASKVFVGSVVAYANEIKKNVLGVKQAFLDEYGAVSNEVVKEMSFGLKKLLNADIAISVSGIAGPEGGSLQKPVGTVYFGFLFGNNFYSKKEIIIGTRTRIMSRVTNMVFVEILNNLKGVAN